MSDTGGGHRASANALRDAWDTLYPGMFVCDIVDLYTEYGPCWPFDDYPRLYKIMAKYSFLWDWFYRFGETDFGLWLNEFLLDTICFSSFRECLNRGDDKRADMVVSVHPLCQDIPLKILAHLDSNGQTREPRARTTPFATVVTDLGSAHPTWFNPNVDKCFVPGDVLYRCALDRRLKDSQIVQHGLPIRKGFWNPEPARKQELGLETDLPTVLVVGGGDGMGGIVDIARNLAPKSNGEEYQLVVVCGNNAGARDTLLRENYPRTQIKGFVQNMDQWMQASDVLVTKAGPGTIAEASICGLPCMLFSFLPGQEEGNVPFVENAGFGRFSGDPGVIAETVRSWVRGDSTETLESMRSRALAASRPSATLDIAKDLAELLFRSKQENTPTTSKKEEKTTAL